MHTYINTNIHTYILKYMHTYTYIMSYVYTHIHKDIPMYNLKFNVLLTVHHAMILGSCPTAIWYNKTCRLKQVTPRYKRICASSWTIAKNTHVHIHTHILHIHIHTYIHTYIRT